MKYLVIQRFRLVDVNQYLDAGVIYEPDVQYERTSRSLAAAKRAGWVQGISDKKAAQLEEQQYERDQKVLESKENVKKVVTAPVGTGVDFKPEDIADEVLPGANELVEARDSRKNETTEIEDSDEDAAETTKTDSTAETTKTDSKDTVTDIKNEINKKTKKKMRIRMKSK